jgi:hypothetical protein
MKSLFLRRNFREKVLVLLMLVVALVIWASIFAERFGAVMDERERLNRAHAELKVYLDNRDIIRERAQEGIQKLDPRRTLDNTALFREIAALARKHGLNPAVDPARTEPGEVFSYHTVSLSVSEADLAALVSFTSELQGRAPYMALEQVALTSRPNPMLLDARFRISAVQLNP